ncbi:Protein BFR2 [Tolypocladium ophioglossoides CBS 100239]|uniref:Protein BFR2 n=1 Tax=Tolypocladium ophioglossoides (strain CBS 100239) TaxID=1163406 RepID=A0A0L0N956_TOLOC|nr:Protein BFR2 [Tolypocladium ophioglossoides CBS 100239]
MAKTKGRAKQFQDPDEQVTNGMRFFVLSADRRSSPNSSADYDPEANAPRSDHGSDSDVSEDENAGTEHYVSVGKSKLREKEGVSLGPQYRGSRVSRSALEEDSDEAEDEDGDEESESDAGDEYDDPETANLRVDEAQANDSEIDSDDALAESDAERFNGFSFRGSSKPVKPKGKASSRATAADFMSSSDEEDERGGAEVDQDDMSGVELDGSDVEEDMDDGLDALVDGGDDSEESEDADEEEEEEEEEESEDEDDGDEESDGNEDDKSTGTKSQDARPPMAALSNRLDVEKGIAIQQQRKIYDGLLNLRIRLQKALVAANTFPTMEAGSDSESEPYEAAEEAAIKLLNTISSLRDNFGASTKTGDKRKRELVPSMSREAIWEQLQEEDQGSVKFREDRLEKWSRKVQSVNVQAPSGLGQRNKTLISALQEQLGNPDSRLVKRTRVPRSCAPAQAAKKLTEDENVYDDADFYQLLLKELVDQRTVETSSASASAVPTVMLTAAKEAKTRKQVDRKASKGRKMRFTVHEKLQNFMAPEDRRSWEPEAIDRFFGTLFGRKMELNEGESEDEEMEGLDAEDEGLRLFRN